MHVVALNQFYAPHTSATAQLLRELAEGLVGRGHRVTVVTSGPRFASTFRKPGRSQNDRVVNGVRLIRIPSTHLGKANLVRRVADYATFYAEVLRTLVTMSETPDVFLPLTTPPFIAVAAQLAALPSRTPVVALVQDLYPDIAVRLGVLKHRGIAHRALGALSGASLRRATHLIALSEPMAAHLRRYGVRPGLIDVIPNWALAEVESQAAMADGAQARLEYGLGERFVVMYSGNLGAAHQFETLLAAARRLRDRPEIVFAFVGDGVRKPEVERYVAKERLENVRVLPLAPREQLAQSLAAGDVHVITLRDGLEGLLVPSKLYGALAAERPALFIGPRHDIVAETLEEADAGTAFDTGDVSGVADAIVRLADDRELGKTMGVNGRRYLERHLSRSQALDAYERVLLRALARGATKRARGGETTSPSSRAARRSRR